MCLAVPTNSIRPQEQYAFQSFAAARVAARSDGRSCRSHQNHSGAVVVADALAMSATNSSSVAGNYNGFSFGSRFEISSTPPPDINCALGPAGMSPVLSRVAAAPIAAATKPPLSSSAPLSTSPSSATKAAPSAKRRRRGPQRPGKTATDKERLFVQHDYHDLSLEPDALPGGDGPSTSKKTDQQATLLTESFPMKLHRILEETCALGQSHIISWQPHGRAFKIHKPALFTSQIMPLYFPKMKKLTSFQRQFNLYGFERLTRHGPDSGAYYHEAFLRFRPELSAQRMVRRRVKGTGYKAASNPEAEPELYGLPFMEEVMRNQGWEENDICEEQQQEQTSSSFCPKYDPSCLYSDSGTERNEAGSGSPGFVTESSYGSNTEESISHQERNQWQTSEVSSSSMKATASAPVASNCMPQLHHQQDSSLHSQVYPPSVGRLLSLPEAAQDSFLQDFFLGNDVTPLSPKVQSCASSPSARTGVDTKAFAPRQQKQQVLDHPILCEFADLWEASPFT
ncbi:hypothetical protein ACHAXR_003688 [Thalassiosira sp. AJA248-18]